MLKQICVSVLLGCLSFNGLGYNGPAEDPVPPKPCNECPSDANANNECVSYKFEFGSAAHEPDFPVGVFSIYGRRPSETMFTPLGLYYYHPLFTRLAGVSEENGKQIVKLQGPNREIEIYEFAANSSIGYPGGVFRNKLKKVLVMLDADHEPTTISPAYYKLVDENANYVLYSVEEQKAVSYTTSTGRVLTADSKDVRLETILDAEGAIMQVYSGVDGLADVVVTAEELGYIRTYEIRLYHPSQVGAKVNNKYTVSGQPYMTYQVINPNHPQEQTITENGETHIQIVPPEIREIQFIKVANGSNRIASYTYSDAVDDWTLTQDGGNVIVSRAKTVQTRATGAAQGLVIERKNGTGKVAYKESQTLQKFDFGDLPTQITRGTNDTTTYTYYEDINQPGSYGKKKTVQFSDGYWEKYYYDDQRRLNMIVSPFKNQTITVSESEAKVEIISFSSVDSRDIPFAGDPRPRMKETKINNITVAKEYFAYFSDTNGDYVEIHEVCQGAAAEYGNLANARTEKRYYGDKNDSTTLGRLKSVVFSNGLMDSYVYAYGNFTQSSSPGNSSFAVNVNGYALKTTITHGTADSPTGIANKTTQTEKIGDAFGNPVMEKEYVCTRAAAAATDTTPAVTASYEQLSWENATFNATHQQLNTYNSRNEETNTTWDCCNKASYTDEVGIQYTYTYDSMNRLISETKKGYNGSSDVIASYTYDANNKLLNKTVTAGSLSMQESFVYDQAGRLVSTTNPQGLVTTFQFNGNTATTTYPGGATEVVTLYHDLRIASITGTAQPGSFFDYGVEANGASWTQRRLGAVDSPRYNKITNDMSRRPLSEENSAFGGAVNLTTYRYNGKGQLVEQTQTGQMPRLYQYDDYGAVIRYGIDVDGNGELVLASNDRIMEVYSDFEKIGSSWYFRKSQLLYPNTDSAEIVTAMMTKDRLTGLSSTTVAERKTLDVHGNETTLNITLNRAQKKVTESTTYPDSTIAEQLVFVNGLLTSSRSKDNLTTNYAYNGLGMLTGIIDPRTGNTTISYHTATGKKWLRSTVTTPTGDTTTYDYDATGRLLWEKNALNQYTRYAYNPMGKVTQVWGESPYPVTFTYDSYGDMITMNTYRNTEKNFGGVTFPTVTGDLTTWTRDAASGLVSAKSDAAGNNTSYTYNVNGNLTSRIWARGIVTNYAYSPIDGQLLDVDYGDDTADIAYTYNRVGLVSKVIDAAGTRNFSYNATLDLIAESISGIYTKELDWSYATSGMKGKALGMSVGGVNNYSYGYDTYGRINQVNDIDYAYLPNSNLLSQINRPNNVNTTWSYEPNRNLVTEVANGNISTFGYTNNAIGNRTTMNRSGSAFGTPDTISYTYDNRAEVTTALSSVGSSYHYQYNYDPIGNRLTSAVGSSSINYISNELNQYTQVGTQNPTYDADGNMLTNDGWTYTWNGENRLIQAIKGTTKLQFDYDYAGRRIEKKVYNGNTLNAHTRFVYNGFKLVEELSALDNNATTKRYTWQPDELGLDVPLTMTMGATTYYYQTDANKNVTELTTRAGTVAAHYEYTPFGEQTKATGTIAAENPFRFSSEYYDTETGLVYYNFRYYSPKLGRWIKEDPIGEDGGYNLYASTKNNTINFYDKLGLWYCCGRYRVHNNVSCCNNMYPYNAATHCCQGFVRSRKDPDKCQEILNLCLKNTPGLLAGFIDAMSVNALPGLVVTTGSALAGSAIAGPIGAGIGALVGGAVVSIKGIYDIAQNMNAANAFAQKCAKYYIQCMECTK